MDPFADLPLEGEDPFASLPNEGEDPFAGLEEEEPSVGMDVARQLAAGLGRGAYNLANLPTSLANLAASGVNAVTGGDFQFKRPLEAAAPSVDDRYTVRPEAETAAGQLAGTIGEIAGGDLPLAATGVGLAPALARRTAMSTGKLGGTVHQLASAMARSRGKVLAGETAASAGAGTGLETARAVTENPVYQTGAAIVGGMAPGAAAAVSPTRLVSALARKGMAVASPKARTERAKMTLAGEMGRELTPEALEEIARTREIAKVAPDWSPTVAEASESPALIATQQQLEADMSGGELDQAIKRYRSNDQAIARGREDLAPQAPADPARTVVRSGEQRLDTATGRIDEALAALEGQERGIASRLQADNSRADTGASLREDLIANRTRRKEEMSTTARDMELNDTRPLIPADGIKNAMLDAVKPRSGIFTDSELLPRGIMKALDGLDDGARVSVSDLMELRSRIGDEIADVQRLPGARKRTAYLESMREALDTQAESAMRGAGLEDVAEQMKEFRSIYRKDYIEPFEQGAAKAALETDSSRGYKVRDEEVAGKFFSAWNETAAKQFDQAFGDSQVAARAMETAALDDLYASASRDGILSPTAVEAWRRRHSSVLEKFPAIGAKVADVDQLYSGIAKRRADLLNRKRSVESSWLARELGGVDRAARSPEDAIARAIANPDRMKSLARSIRSPEAKAGLSRAAWDQALDSGAPLEFLRKNEQALKVAMGPKHFQAAELLARGMEKNAIVRRPSGKPIKHSGANGIEDALGTGLNQIGSRVFAVKSGRTSARYAATDIAGRALRAMTGRQARGLLKEAIYDPRVAQDLAMYMGTGRAGRSQIKRIGAYMLSSGLAIEADEDEE